MLNRNLGEVRNILLGTVLGCPQALDDTRLPFGSQHAGGYLNVEGSAMTSITAMQLRQQLSATTRPSASWLSIAMLH